MKEAAILNELRLLVYFSMGFGFVAFHLFLIRFICFTALFEKTALFFALFCAIFCNKKAAPF